jgi:type I restriction enzyme S subunit
MNSNGILIDCNYKPLKELLSFIVDNRGKSVPTSEDGIPLIATNCIKNTELYPTFDKVRYVSDEIYDNWFRAHPKPGDIIFVNKGKPGSVVMVPDPVNFCIAQDMMAFRVNDELIYNKYLFAVLRSPYFQAQINNYHVGTMIPHFKKGDLDKLMIPLPEKFIQEYIGDLYFKFSIKIEVNNQINKILEDMAQALFKQWFVDFEFPNEDGEPYQSSGGEMVESELGMIPKGWEVGTFNDLGNIVGGGTPSKAREDYFTDFGIPWVTPKDLSNNRNKYFSRGATDITEEGLKNSSARLMPEGTVLFSSRAPIGYITISKNEICTNQGFKSIVPDERIGSEYVYQSLKANIEVIENRATGSTFKEISGGELKKINIVLSDYDLIKSYNEIVNPISKLIMSKENEIEILKETRDSLLPKLMSGEIRVPLDPEGATT